MLLWHYCEYVHTRGKLEAPQILPCIPDNLGTQMVKNPLKNGMATHSSILAWRIPMDRGAWLGYHPWGCKDLDTTEQFSTAQEREDTASQNRNWLVTGPPRPLHPWNSYTVFISTWQYLSLHRLIICISPSPLGITISVHMTMRLFTSLAQCLK